MAHDGDGATRNYYSWLMHIRLYYEFMTDVCDASDGKRTVHDRVTTHKYKHEPTINNASMHGHGLIWRMTLRVNIKGHLSICLIHCIWRCCWRIQLKHHEWTVITSHNIHDAFDALNRNTPLLLLRENQYDFLWQCTHVLYVIHIYCSRFCLSMYSAIKRNICCNSFQRYK